MAPETDTRPDSALQDMAKIWRGRDWVPLDAALAELQFWQRRDFEHTLAASVTRGDIIETADRLAKRMGGRFVPAPKEDTSDGN